MLKEATALLRQRKSLTLEQSQQATLEMLQDKTNAEDIAQYLIALRAKGETVDEISGVVSALRDHMLTVHTQKRVLDIVGTGGDGACSVNISTGAAILAASCGVPIAKHGNRAVSSLAGSADVLEALGIDLAMSPARIAQCIDEVNIGFCFAPQFHPALARLRDIRRNLGIPTVFNLVGPFLNPARAAHYVMGVFSATLMPQFAMVLSDMQVAKSVIVHSNGLDEISCSDITQLVMVDGNDYSVTEFNPQDYGFPRVDRSLLCGGNGAYNARLLTQTLAGKAGPIADAFIVNAAMVIYIYGLRPDLTSAIELAREHLLSGAGLELLRRWKAFSDADG